MYRWWKNMYAVLLSSIVATLYLNGELIDESIWMLLSVVNIHLHIIPLTSSGHSSWGQWPIVSAAWLYYFQKSDCNCFLGNSRSYSIFNLPASSSLISIPSQCFLNIASLELESAIGSFIPWKFERRESERLTDKWGYQLLFRLR